MTIETHHYRADIDGLRALAIVPVVLYHAGVPGFSGGFVGVDVFFVISGYLITSIIEREIRAGRFSLARFYERRIRRIIPALFAMLVGCAIASPLLLYPTEYLSFARSLITATLFVSTFQFRREGGYFDVESAHKPLLHTWSLSVEEIFYVFFPVLAVLLWRCCRARRVPLIRAVAIVSFVACTIALYRDAGSRAAFFLPHFRAWEFLVGALLALGRAGTLRGRHLADAMSVVGVLMIGAAVVGYSDSTTFPGAAALVPCLGAAAVIVAGQHRRSLAGRALSTRPFVFTGLVSYSLYLWHWPVLVFAGLWIGRRPAGWEVASLIALSFVLAVVSWRYVERPFRGKSGLLSRRSLFASTAGAGALIVLVGLHGVLTHGWLGRYPEAFRVILESSKDRDPRQKECLTTDLDAAGCIYGRQTSPPTIALWGDSYAAVYSVMLGRLAQADGGAVLALTMPSCPPVEGWQFDDQKWRKSCERFQRAAMGKILETASLDTVVLAASFTVYARSAGTKPEFATALSAVVDRLLGAGKRVIVVYPYPTLDSQALDAMARAAADGKDLGDFARPLAAFLQENRPGFDLLDSLGERPGLLRIRPHAGLCDGTHCFAYRDGTALYYDHNHVSLAGADMLAGLFEPLLNVRRSDDQR